MALSRLLAFASSARPADILVATVAAITARTAPHFATVLVSFPNVYRIRSSAVWLGEIALGAMLLICFACCTALTNSN